MHIRLHAFDSVVLVLFQVFPRRMYHRFMVIIIHLHELVVDSSQSKTTFSLQGQVQIAIFLKLLYFSLKTNDADNSEHLELFKNLSKTLDNYVYSQL